MLPKSTGLTSWIAALLLALYSAPAAADVAAGVAAYKQSDFTTAFREFQEAAQRDDVRALNYLGIMHADGIGTPRDDTQAAAMFSKAALLGFPEAMANLARMHATGRGVPQNNEAAVAAYRAAARNGFQPAIVRMAEIYENGELGEAPDPAIAREWRARLQGQTQPVPSAPPVVAATVSNAIEAVAVTKQVEPGETPDMAALAREARAQLQAQQTQPVAAAPPEVAAIAQNTIESVAVTKQSDRILIRVRTNAPLAQSPASFTVATPPSIAFDFPHTVTGLGRHHEVGEGDLHAINVIQSGGRTRMVLILRSMMQHDAKLDGRDLLVTLTTIK